MQNRQGQNIPSMEMMRGSYLSMNGLGRLQSNGLNGVRNLARFPNNIRKIELNPLQGNGKNHFHSPQHHRYNSPSSQMYPMQKKGPSHLSPLARCSGSPMSVLSDTHRMGAGGKILRQSRNLPLFGAFGSKRGNGFGVARGQPRGFHQLYNDRNSLKPAKDFFVSPEVARKRAGAHRPNLGYQTSSRPQIEAISNKVSLRGSRFNFDAIRGSRFSPIARSPINKALIGSTKKKNQIGRINSPEFSRLRGSKFMNFSSKKRSGVKKNFIKNKSMMASRSARKKQQIPKKKHSFKENIPSFSYNSPVARSRKMTEVELDPCSVLSAGSSSSKLPVNALSFYANKTVDVTSQKHGAAGSFMKDQNRRDLDMSNGRSEILAALSTERKPELHLDRERLRGSSTDPSKFQDIRWRMSPAGSSSKKGDFFAENGTTRGGDNSSISRMRGVSSSLMRSSLYKLMSSAGSNSRRETFSPMISSRFKKGSEFGEESGASASKLTRESLLPKRIRQSLLEDKEPSFPVARALDLNKKSNSEANLKLYTNIRKNTESNYQSQHRQAGSLIGTSSVRGKGNQFSKISSGIESIASPITRQSNVTLRKSIQGSTKGGNTTKILSRVSENSENSTTQRNHNISERESNTSLMVEMRRKQLPGAVSGQLRMPNKKIRGSYMQVHRQSPVPKMKMGSIPAAKYGQAPKKSSPKLSRHRMVSSSYFDKKKNQALVRKQKPDYVPGRAGKSPQNKHVLRKSGHMFQSGYGSQGHIKGFGGQNQMKSYGQQQRRRQSPQQPFKRRQQGYRNGIGGGHPARHSYDNIRKYRPQQVTKNPSPHHYGGGRVQQQSSDKFSTRFHMNGRNWVKESKLKGNRDKKKDGRIRYFGEKGTYSGGKHKKVKSSGQVVKLSSSPLLSSSSQSLRKVNPPGKGKKKGDAKRTILGDFDAGASDKNINMKERISSKYKEYVPLSTVNRKRSAKKRSTGQGSLSSGSYTRGSGSNNMSASAGESPQKPPSVPSPVKKHNYIRNIKKVNASKKLQQQQQQKIQSPREKDKASSKANNLRKSTQKIIKEEGIRITSQPRTPLTQSKIKINGAGGGGSSNENSFKTPIIYSPNSSSSKSKSFSAKRIQITGSSFSQNQRKVSMQAAKTTTIELKKQLNEINKMSHNELSFEEGSYSSRNRGGARNNTKYGNLIFHNKDEPSSKEISQFDTPSMMMNNPLDSDSDNQLNRYLNFPQQQANFTEESSDVDLSQFNQKQPHQISHYQNNEAAFQAYEAENYPVEGDDEEYYDYDNPDFDGLVDNRHISYSYDGVAVPFLKRIADKQFENMLPGFEQYIYDCEVQAQVAMELKKGLAMQPFRGAVDVPFTHDSKKLLLLDLDETLIHSEQLPMGAEPGEDHCFAIDIPLLDDSGEIETFGVNVRPYCQEFIKRMSKVFEIAIFTASTKPYCDPIVNELDPDNLISHRLYRCHCTEVDGKLIKDLATLKNRQKEDIIIIDNLINSFSNDIENGIPIKPFVNEKDDYELKYIADVLEEVNQSTTCPFFLQAKFKLMDFYNQFFKKAESSEA